MLNKKTLIINRDEIAQLIRNFQPRNQYIFCQIHYCDMFLVNVCICTYFVLKIFHLCAVDQKYFLRKLKKKIKSTLLNKAC